MRSNNLAAFELTRNFVPNLVFRDNLLHFDQVGSTISSSLWADALYGFDADYYNGEILQVIVAQASIHSSPALYYSFANQAGPILYTLLTHDIYPSSRPGLIGNVLYYQSYATGKIVKTVFNGVNLWTTVNANFFQPFSGAQTIYPVACAPTNSIDGVDTLYAHYFVTSTDGPNNVGYICMHNSNMSLATDRWMWSGTISSILPQSDDMLVSAIQTAPLFDAVNIRIVDDDNGIYDMYDMVFVADQGGQRALFLENRYTNSEINHTGPLTPVIPLDVVDDTSAFVFGCVSTIGYCPITFQGMQLKTNQLVVTGIIKRDTGPQFHMYTIGPNNFTFGRDLYIGVADDDRLELPGKMLSMATGAPQFIGYATPTKYFSAAATKWTGAQNGSELVLTDVVSAQIQCVSNQAYSLTVEIPYFDGYSYHISPGYEMDFSVQVNAADRSDTTQIAVFDIDSVVPNKTAQSNTIVINARSKAIKRLSEWQSDASFDYWSQTKLSTLASDLGQILQMSGTWTADADNDNTLSLNELNLGGILYVSSQSSSGAISRIKFQSMAGDFNPRVGVGVNYYQETADEAAARLDIDLTDVTNTDLANNGIFAIYDRNMGCVEIWMVGDGTWLSLHSANVTFTAGDWYWLQIKYQDGRILVHYRPDSSPTWILLIDYLYASTLYLAFKRDGIGRGAIFAMNQTATVSGYPFLSDSDIIPADLDHEDTIEGTSSTTTFPTADTVIVDEEQIAYAYKAVFTTVPNLNYVYGDILASWTPSNPTVYAFADLRTRDYVRQTFTLSANKILREIKVYVNKTGYPDDNLVVSIYRAPISVSAPFGTLVASSEITSDNISQTGGWVSVPFSKVEIHSGDWIIMTRGNGVLTVDTSNYYGVYAAGNYTGGQFSIFNDATDKFTLQSVDTCFILYGEDATLVSEYPVHVSPNAALSGTTDYYVDAALVVTAGGGSGSSYKIVGYTPGSTTNIIFTDSEATGLDETSVFSITSAFYGLTRAYDGTIAASHDGTKIDLYRAGPCSNLSTYEYFTQEPDMSLEDMVTSLARKAGVLSVTSDLAAPVMVSTNNVLYNRKNFILTFDNYYLNNDYPTAKVELIGRYLDSSHGVKLDFTSDTISFYLNNILTEVYPVDAPCGTYKVSCFDTTVSVWRLNKLICSFTIPDAYINAGDGIVFPIVVDTSGATTSDVILHLSQACMRIDNYILDMGTRGSQLMDNLIGEKRFYYQDDSQGGLRLFYLHPTCLNSFDPPTSYLLAIENEDTTSTLNLFTRLRVEGSDIHERMDPDAMRNYGNIFNMLNMNEINNEDEAQWFSNAILVDTLQRLDSKVLTGPADPKIEPNDTITATLPEGDSQLIIDEVDYDIGITETDVHFDMKLTGHKI